MKRLRSQTAVAISLAVAALVVLPPSARLRAAQEPAGKAGSAATKGLKPRGGRPSTSVARPRVISIPSPNKDGRGGTKIDTILMHHTAGGGTAQDVGQGFQDSSREVSSHYIVDKAGTIVQSVADKDRSWHAGRSTFKGREDVNGFSIGIEMVNRGDGKDPFTDKQYRALGRLVAYLQDAYNIPRGRVTGHKDVALPRGRKSDPAPNFSYDRLFKEVARARSD